MRGTLEMMRGMIIGNEAHLSFESLLLEYKEKQSPNILAFLFVQNYGLINKISVPFHLLTSEDIAGFSLQELDKCLLHFDITRNVKFSTYYANCLKNKLRHEQQFLTTDLQFANYNIEDLQEYEEILDMQDNYDVLNLDCYGLSDSEKAQCNMIMNGYSMKEIANHFKITTQAVWYRNKNISKKLLLDF